MYKKINSYRGITLIALVITIVILIILATVAINAAFGDSGLISQAEKAAEYQANAEASDSKMINDATEYIDTILNKDNGEDEEPEEPPAEYTDIYITGYMSGILGFNNTTETLEGEEVAFGPMNIKGEEYTISYDQSGLASINTPWYQYRENVYTVVFMNEIVPSNVAGWFLNCTNLTNIYGIEK